MAPPRHRVSRDRRAADSARCRGAADRRPSGRSAPPRAPRVPAAAAGLSRDTGAAWLGIECAGRAACPPEGGSPMPVSARIRAAAAAFSPVTRFYFDVAVRPAAARARHLRLHLRQSARDAACTGSSPRSATAPCPATRTGSPTRPARRSRRLSSPSTLGRELGLAFEPADIALTAGAFGAIMVALHLVLDAGDEAIFSEPAWFCYEPMLLAADAVPRKVALRRAGLRPRPRARSTRRSGRGRGWSSSTRRTTRPGASTAARRCGSCRSARARLGADRPPHLPAVGRALSPAPLRRDGLRQPGGASIRGR